MRDSRTRFARRSLKAYVQACFMLAVADIDQAGRRDLGRQQPRSWQLTRSGLARIVAVDVDNLSGVAVVWARIRHYGCRSMTYHIQYEFRRSGWYSLGSDAMSGGERFAGPRPSIQQAGPACILVRGASGGGRSSAGWVNYETYRAGQEVTELKVGHRIVTIQPNGYCVLAWKSQGNDGFASRPLIRALGGRGEVLTELHPGEQLDTTTLASISLDEPD